MLISCDFCAVLYCPIRVSSLALSLIVFVSLLLPFSLLLFLPPPPPALSDGGFRGIRRRRGWRPRILPPGPGARPLRALLRVRRPLHATAITHTRTRSRTHSRVCIRVFSRPRTRSVLIRPVFPRTFESIFIIGRQTTVARRHPALFLFVLVDVEATADQWGWSLRSLRR